MAKRPKSRVRVDTALVERALALSDERSASAVATTALREYLERHERGGMLEWMGRVDYHDHYDHKAARRRKVPTSSD